MALMKKSSMKSNLYVIEVVTKPSEIKKYVSWRYKSFSENRKKNSTQFPHTEELIYAKKFQSEEAAYDFWETQMYNDPRGDTIKVIPVEYKQSIKIIKAVEEVTNE